MARKTYYIEIGGSKYAWRGEESKYKDIASVCGIKVASNSTKGLLFGANYPKPARVRISFEDSVINDDRNSEIIFCAPAKVGTVLEGGLKGKKSNGKKISLASLPG